MLHRHCKGYSDNKCLSINKFFTGLYRLVCSLQNFTSILFYNFLFSPEVLFLLALFRDKVFLWLFSFELYFLSTFYYWIEFWRDAMNVQGNTRLYEHAYLFYILFLYIIVLHVYISCMFLFHVSSTGNLCVFLSMGIYLTEIVKILSLHELYGILILYMSLNVTKC